MPMTALATQLHRISMTHGHGDSDTSAVISLLSDKPLA
jgi:3-hydroxyisobutyrate dehydrogenase